MTNEHLQRIFQHNRWANRLIMDACRDLTPEQLTATVVGTFGELGQTLAHITAAEAWYVWRFDKTDPAFDWDDEQPVPPVGEMATILDQTGARFVELATTTPDDQILTYERQGQENRWPAWVVLGQVIDHGREHRSHVATILTQLGIEPPDMDMWAYGEAVQDGRAE